MAEEVTVTSTTFDEEIHRSGERLVQNSLASEKLLHLAGLNGLRAIAAFAVVISHFRRGLELFHLPRMTSSQLAQYGVTIFFALSGFLITYLLLLEKSAGTVHIQKFYARRILRIWPLYYGYLALNLLTAAWFHQSGPAEVLPFYIFMMANIPFALGFPLPRLEHYWSLGVEEQFYLFWPALVRFSRKPLRTVILITVGDILFRLALRLLKSKWEAPTALAEVTRFDCMGIGAIGACLYHQQHPGFLRVCQNAKVQLACWGLLGLTAANLYSLKFFAHDLVAVVTVAIIISQVTRSNRIINLDKPIFELLGKISYGIYVIHPLVLFYYARFLNGFELGDQPKMVLAGVGTLGITFALAFLSYRFFERPFLRIKDRFAIIPTKA